MSMKQSIIRESNESIDSIRRNLFPAKKENVNVKHDSTSQVKSLINKFECDAKHQYPL
jgi:hypothetical protein